MDQSPYAPPKTPLESAGAAIVRRPVGVWLLSAYLTLSVASSFAGVGVLALGILPAPPELGAVADFSSPVYWARFLAVQLMLLAGAVLLFLRYALAIWAFLLLLVWSIADAVLVDPSGGVPGAVGRIVTLSTFAGLFLYLLVLAYCVRLRRRGFFVRSTLEDVAA